MRVAATRRTRLDPRAIIATVAVLLLIGAMALSTKVVKLDSAAGARPGGFSEAQFGETEFPKVQAAIEKRAVNAATLAAAIAKNQTAAAKTYGVTAGDAIEIPVKFTGVVGKGDLGSYTVTIDGVPKSVVVSIQTGPAILGTDLRDATGTIDFGQFKNQIEYQNAGSALNKEMKKDVLAKVDTDKLTGKTITVVGAFALTDPASWTITPVKLDVR